MNGFCREPTEARLLDIARFEYQKETRTCIASSRLGVHTERFQRVGRSTWVATDTLKGPCGVVNVGRFEKESEVKFKHWRYYDKNVVTNPAGKVLGFSCSELDQNEYLYDWRSKEWPLGCDYLEFGLH